MIYSTIMTDPLPATAQSKGVPSSVVALVTGLGRALLTTVQGLRGSR